MIKRRILALCTAFAVSAATLAVMSSADNADDGLPILEGTYEQSEFYGHGPLGVANDFHLFAFDQININAHCNGNFAAPVVNVNGQANGNNQIEGGKDNSLGSGDGKEISIATISLDMSGSTVLSHIFIPEGYYVTDLQGNDVTINPETGLISGQVVLNGKKGAGPDESTGSKHVDLNSKSAGNGVDIRHAPTAYLDFESYRAFYEDMSLALSWANDNNNGFYYEDQNNIHVDLLETGMNVVNITPDMLGNNTFTINDAVIDEESHKYTGEQCIVINVDLAGYEDFQFNAQVKIKRTNGEEVGNKEENVYTNTVTLWNFYDSSSADGMYHGKITYGKTSIGAILAPCADIDGGNVNLDGNIIANSIKTGGESHRCDFVGRIVLPEVPTVSIVKVGKDGKASEELPGAKMELTYTGKGSIEDVIATGATITKDTKKNTITWTSGEENVVLKKIPDGTYTLKETAAPDGYEIATTITFTVKDGKITKVNIKEGSGSSYKDGVIAMFDKAKTTTTSEPEVTTSEPVVTTSEPEVTTSEPVVTTSEPEVTTSEPEVTTSEPVVTTSEPEVTTSEPEVTTSEPVVTTSEPEVTTSEPEVTTSEPEVTTSEPVVTTSEPVVTTSEPEVTTSEPVVTTSEPEVTTSAPEATKTPEVTTTPSGSVGDAEDDKTTTTTATVGDAEDDKTTTTTDNDPNGVLPDDDTNGAGTGSDDDEGNPPKGEVNNGEDGSAPKTGEAAPIALIVILIGASIFVTLTKKNKKFFM